MNRGVLLGFIMLLAGPAYGNCNLINFHASSQVSCSPGLITFYATGAPTGSTYFWDLGNGFVQGTDTAFRSFVNAGFYTIKLRVRLPDNSFCDTITKVNYIQILPTPQPIINASQRQLCNGPGSVTFTDNTPGIVSREWIIDGQRYENAPATIIHAFTSIGNKSVTLRVTSTNGCIGVFTQTNYIIVSQPITAELCANFTQTSNAILANISFSLSPGGPAITSYAWSFPGGTPSTATTANPPQISYPLNIAPQDVSVDVTTSSGCVYTIKRTAYVRKLFQSTVDSACVGETFRINQFVNSGGRGYISYNIPGGHVVAQTGTYIDLYFTSSGSKTFSVDYKYSGQGCNHNYTAPNAVFIKGPRADFTSIDRISCDNPHRTPLINTTTAPAGFNTTYTWKFFNENKQELTAYRIGPTTVKDTAVTINGVGLYTVSLIATSNNGCADTVTKNNFIRIGKPSAAFSASDTVICAGEKITFYDESTPELPVPETYFYSWTMTHADDPLEVRQSGVRKPDIIFYKPGKYHARLIIRTSPTCGDTLIIPNYIEVNGIEAGINISSNITCKGSPETLTANIIANFPTDTSNTLIYNWNVDPNENVVIQDSLAQSTSVTFTKNECYRISLEIANQKGCSLSIDHPFPICVGTTPLFFWDKNFCRGDTVDFINFSEGNPSGYKWKVEPPQFAVFVTPDTVPDARIIFNKDTTYTITLYTSNSSNCIDSLVEIITIVSPNANFYSEDTLLYCAPAVVKFTSTSVAGGGLKYVWHMGDGNIIETTNAEPSYSYTMNNNTGYHVKLVVTDNLGCSDSTIRHDYIKVFGPIPKFSIDKTQSCDSLTVLFTDASTNINTFFMDYGDGTQPDSVSYSYHHYYIPSGVVDSFVFTPTLITYDINNCVATYTDTVIIYKTPEVSINSDVRDGCIPLTVNFFSNSAGVKYYEWDLNGDGTTDDSLPNPSFVYHEAKDYDVSLRLTGYGGCNNSDSIPSFISMPDMPFANLNVSRHKGCDSFTVDLVNNSNNYSYYTIDYGNGTSDSSMIRSMHYGFDYNNTTADSQVFYIELIAVNEKLCTHTFSDTIIVYGVPETEFDISILSGCDPLEVSLETDTSFVSTISWEYYESGTIDDTIYNPNVVFGEGIYTINLKRVTRTGCEIYSSAGPLTVFERPIANFIQSDTLICSGTSVSFNDQSFSSYRITDYLWHFEDTSLYEFSSIERNPSPYTYVPPGFYNVTLKVTDENGCSDLILKDSLITVKDTLIIAPLIVVVSAEESTSASARWAKGDSGTFGAYYLYRESDPVDILLLYTDNMDSLRFFEENTLVTETPVCYYLVQEDDCGFISEPTEKHCTIHLTAEEEGVNSIRLNWTHYQGKEPVSYHIYRNNKQNTTYVKIAEVSSTDNTYLDRYLCNTDYLYYVSAAFHNGYFSRSNHAGATPDYLFQVEETDVLNVSVVDNQFISLAWGIGNQQNLKAYSINRNSGSGWVESYATVTGETHNDIKVNVGEKPYVYRIQTIDSCGNKGPEGRHGTSIHLTASVFNDNVKFNWNAYSDWEAGVSANHLELKNFDGSFRHIATVGPDVLTYDLDTIFPELEYDYCFRIRAENAGDSALFSTSNHVCIILPSRIFIPNAFSPNTTDDHNPTFGLAHLSLRQVLPGGSKGFHMAIFNRYGERVFETNDVNKNWDGNYMGHPAPEGVYIYKVRAHGLDGTDYLLHGNVTLLR